jgi:hypothetical protein
MATLTLSVRLFGADATSSAPAGTDLPAWKVVGNVVMADGRPLRLRGINWGWWHLSGTRYSEADMQKLAQWGANTVRLAFSYNDLETEDNPPAWKEDGFKDLDEVAQWGRKYGIHVILDMHVVPGGQSTAPYCAGGHNLLWTDTASQDRFIDLWREIARRYRGRTEVAAYELMNEPGSNQKTPELLRSIDQCAIDAIRTVDPDKIIVVGGDQGSGPGDLVDSMKFPDDNILYTFHWYLGAGGNEDWISTERSDGISGTRDWIKIEKTFTAPPGADHMGVFLRSTGNSRSAWFDDVNLQDATGKILLSDSYDKNSQDYHPEVFQEAVSFDATTGHDKPGSLKIHGTIGPNSWAGWAGTHLRIQPGQSYTVSAWVKLDQATGDTYLGAMFFRVDTQIDPELAQKKISPAVEFARKFKVPVWVGEFGCDASNPDDQIRWVNAAMTLFEKEGFNWTYWNDKETSDPQGMGLQAEHRDGSDCPVNERLLEALRAGWVLNRAP